MPRALRWFCRYGALVLSAVVGAGLLRASGLEFGAGLLQLLAQESAVLGIVTVGALLVFHCGAYDLSLGAVFALCLVALALMLDAGHVGAAVAGMLALGLLVGLLNGVLGFVLQSPMLVGAVMAVAWREAATGVAGVYPLTPQLEGVRALRALSWQSIGGVAPSFLIFIGLALVLHWLLRRSAVGRQIIAVGLGGRQAAMAGVRVPLYRVACFGVGGLAAGLGALSYFSLLATASPQVGTALPIDVLAAIVIGNGGLHRERPAPLRVAAAVLCLTAVHTGAPGAMDAPWSALLVTVLLVAAALLGQVLHRPVA